MARLNIIQARGKFSMRIPHLILVDGRLLGMMKSKQVSVEMPAGEYDVKVQSMVKFISATQHVAVSDAAPVDLTFQDREQVWDILFVVDILCWTLKRFLHLSNPWSWMYEVFTNGYFVLWLIYEWRIKDRYFKFQVNTANP